jgi:threonyl-tRNA synthetase
LWDEFTRVEVTPVEPEPISVTLPNGAVITGVKHVTTPFDVAQQASLPQSVIRKAVVAKIKGPGVEAEGAAAASEDLMSFDNETSLLATTPSSGQASTLWDLSRPLEGDCEIALLTFDDDEGRYVFWHSSAHLVGAALEATYGSKLSIGPSSKTEDGGFFYDAYMGTHTIVQDDYAGILKSVQGLVKAKDPFERGVFSKVVPPVTQPFPCFVRCKIIPIFHPL